MNEAADIFLNLIVEIRSLDCVTGNKTAEYRLGCLDSILRNDIRTVLSVSSKPLNQVKILFPGTVTDELMAVEESVATFVMTPAASESIQTVILENGQFKIEDGVRNQETVVCYLIKYRRGIIKDEICFSSFEDLPRYQAMSPAARYDYGVIECPAIQYFRRDVIGAFPLMKVMTKTWNLFLTGNRQSIKTHWDKAYQKIRDSFFTSFRGGQTFINHDGETGLEVSSLLSLNNRRIDPRDQTKRHKRAIEETIELLMSGLSEKESLYQSEHIESLAGSLKQLQDKKWQLEKKRNQRREELRQRRNEFVLRVKQIIRDFADRQLPVRLKKEMDEYKNRKKFLKVVNDIIQSEEESFREELNETVQQTMDKVVQEQVDLFRADLKEMGRLVEKVVPGYNFEGNLAGLAAGLSVYGTGSLLILGLAYAGNPWNLFQAAIAVVGLHKGAIAAAGTYAAVGGAATVGAVFVVAGLAAFWLSRKIVTKLTWKKMLIEKIQGEVSKYLPDYIKAWVDVIESSYDQVLDKMDQTAGATIDQIVEGIQRVSTDYKINRVKFEAMKSGILREKTTLIALRNKLQEIV